MAAPNKDGWAVNFIYEQDLRSQYMNQMFLEMLQPGVYNPQLYLKPNNPAGGSTNLSLLTGAGTTFIFRNGTNNTTTQPWLIKCTATKPLNIDITGIRILSNPDIDNVAPGKEVISTHGISQENRQAYYIFALMRYHPSKKDKNTYAAEPSACAYYRAISGENANKFIKIRDDIPWAPEEITTDIGYTEEVSWILIGKVNWTLNGQTPVELLSNGTDYSEALEFTGLGAPSYRHGNYLTKNILPSIMPYHIFLGEMSDTSSDEASTPRVKFQGFKPSLEKAYYAGGFLTCNNNYLADINGDSSITPGPDMYKPKKKNNCTWVMAPGNCENWVDIVYGGVKRYPKEKSSTYSTEIEKIQVFALSMPNIPNSENMSKYKNYKKEEISALITVVSEYGTNTEAIPLDMNTTARERKLSLLTEDHPNLLSWALDTAIEENLIASNIVGTDILPIAIVFRTDNDNQELRSDDIVPLLDILAGSDVSPELKFCKPVFSTVNIL